MQADQIVEWLFTNSGPILKYRTAVEFMDLPEQTQAKLLKAALATTEMQRWLDYLENARQVHGSPDHMAENALAKLLDYGLDRRVPAFDHGVKHLLDQPLQQWDPLVLLPFLLRAGYTHHPYVQQWLTDRVEKLYDTAEQCSYDFYLDSEEASKVPKAWRGKPIYRDRFGHAAGYALPTSYDFYALAYCPPSISYIDDLETKCESIVAFLSDPRFQSTEGGYGWDKPNYRCYAAGRVFLACVEPQRLLLFLELGAHFKSARKSEWFRQGIATLEEHQTPEGTYRFPSTLIPEKTGTHIYAGSHMGLGENRRTKLALKLESTFRMLLIKKLTGNLT
jgi:hypothetical protein